MPNCPNCAVKDRQLTCAGNVREEHEKALLHWRSAFDAAMGQIADLRVRLAAAEKRAETAAEDSARLDSRQISLFGIWRVGIDLRAAIDKRRFNAARKDGAK